MATKTPDHDLSDAVEIDKDYRSKLHPLHELQRSIAALPDEDAKKVAEVIAKIQSGKLEINPESIAKKIIDESAGN